MATLYNIGKNQVLDGYSVNSSTTSISRIPLGSYYAVYFGFTIPAGGATSFSLWLQGTSGFTDTYLYIRAGQDPNGAGFGSSILYSDDDSGGSGSSKISLASLAAGNYTADCTSFASLATGTIRLTSAWTDLTPPPYNDYGTSIRRGSGNNFNTPIGANNQLITPDKGYSYSALYSPRESGGYSRNIYVPLPKGGGGGGGAPIVTYYKMRGYYAAWAVYETYVVTGSPSSTPPSGHTLTNVTIITSWRQ